MRHFDRRVEQDLAPVVQSLEVRFAHEVVAEVARTGRDPEDVAKAALVALAATAHALRLKFQLPVQAWAEANRIAQDSRSFTNSLPTLPLTRELAARLAVRSTQSN